MIPVIGFPFVDLAVSINVLFRAGEAAALVVFRARHSPVAARRVLDAFGRATGAGKGPRVFPPVARPREADLLELLVRSVVLPTVNLAVLVEIGRASCRER